VVGNWDDGTAQKVTADAIAVHGQFDGHHRSGRQNRRDPGDEGRGPPLVPVAGESENGFRKLIAEHADEGLKGISIGQSPGLVAIAMKAAISALEGNPMPQLISVPLPVADYTQLEDGVNYWSDLPDNFFTVNEFPPCGVNISGPAIMAKDECGRELNVAGGPLRRSPGGRAARQRIRDPARPRGAAHGRPRCPRMHRACAASRNPTRASGVRALEDVDFACRRGSIHAILGENGAGKSTLIKIMAGVVRPTAARCACAAPGAPSRPDRRGAGRHRLHVPGAVADPRPQRRRQHLDRRPAPPLRHDRPPRPAPPRRGALARVRCEDLNPDAQVRELSCPAARWSRSPRRSGAPPRC
jgi:hypothetical protein